MVFALHITLNQQFPKIYDTGVSWMIWIYIFLQKPLSIASPIVTASAMERVARDFVRMMEEKSEQGCNLQQNDFLEELKKYFLEVTGVFALGVRLGAIKAGEQHLFLIILFINRVGQIWYFECPFSTDLSPESEASLLMEAALETNSNILSTDNR